MKHIELFENRNFRSYKKYCKLLKKRFDASDIQIYDEYRNGNIYIRLEYSYSIDKEILIKLAETFKDFYFRMTVKNSYTVTYEIDDIPKSFFDEIEVELASEKFNL